MYRKTLPELEGLFLPNGSLSSGFGFRERIVSLRKPGPQGRSAVRQNFSQQISGKQKFRAGHGEHSRPEQVYLWVCYRACSGTEIIAERPSLRVKFFSIDDLLTPFVWAAPATEISVNT